MMKPIYTIISKNEIDSKWIFFVELDQDHIIFKGHFPELPIVPGAIQVEMVRELAESIFKKKIKLKEARSIKFIKMVLPSSSAQVEIVMVINELDDVKVIAEIKIDGTVHSKIKANYEVSYSN